MRYCIADIRLSEKCKNALLSRGYSLILMPPFEALSKPVASHPDMLIFFLGGRLFTHKDYYSKNSALIDSIASLTDSVLALTDETVGCDYPCDVLFNAFVFDGRLVCNERTISRAILEYASLKGLSLVSVRQGYTKCSACVTDSFVITADKGILSALSGTEIPAYGISEGQILLDGCSHGFIGGATGYDSKERRLFVCGSVELHTDGKRIGDICSSHGISVVSLSDETPYDHGTLFFI